MTDSPFPALHTAVLGMRDADPCSGSADHDDFTCALLNYALHVSQSDALDTLADVCDRRLTVRRDLPLDLIAAYQALSRLARWRAASLRGAR